MGKKLDKQANQRRNKYTLQQKLGGKIVGFFQVSLFFLLGQEGVAEKKYLSEERLGELDFNSLELWIWGEFNIRHQCLCGGHQGYAAGLITALQSGRTRNNEQLLKRERLTLTIRRNFSHERRVTGFAVFALGGFQALTRRSSEQLGLVPEMNLLPAGGWTRGLLRSLCARVIL